MAKGSSRATNTPKFIISNNNMQLKKDIVNIASRAGVSYSQFLRSEIIKIRDSYPESARQPLKDY